MSVWSEAMTDEIAERELSPEEELRGLLLEMKQYLVDNCSEDELAQQLIGKAEVAVQTLFMEEDDMGDPEEEAPEEEEEEEEEEEGEEEEEEEEDDDYDDEDDEDYDDDEDDEEDEEDEDVD